MEHVSVDECGLNKFDWKYWRRFEAINQERTRKGEALMAEECEMQKYRCSESPNGGGKAASTRSRAR